MDYATTEQLSERDDSAALDTLDIIAHWEGDDEDTGE